MSSTATTICTKYFDYLVTRHEANLPRLSQLKANAKEWALHKKALEVWVCESEGSCDLQWCLRVRVQNIPSGEILLCMCAEHPTRSDGSRRKTPRGRSCVRACVRVWCGSAPLTACCFSAKYLLRAQLRPDSRCDGRRTNTTQDTLESNPCAGRYPCGQPTSERCCGQEKARGLS